MRVQIITNPNRTNEISKFNTSDDTTMPSVSTSLRPISRKDINILNIDNYNNCKSGIYKFTNKINNKVYIGSAIDLKDRIQTHIYRKSCYSKLLRNAINKYGIENFVIEILEYVQINTYLDLHPTEQKYIDDYLKRGKKEQFMYNIAEIAGGGGFKWSEQAIINLKNKFKKDGHSCLGRKYSQFTINKISNTHKERGVSVGIKNPNYGKKGTLEKKQKSLETMIKTGTVYLVYRIYEDGNIESFYNIKDYCKNNNFETKGIYLCLENKIRSYKKSTYCKEEDLDKKLNEIKINKNYWTRKKLNDKNFEIVVINNTTKELKEFFKISDLCKWTNTCYSSIQKAIKNNRDFKNYTLQKFIKL